MLIDAFCLECSIDIGGGEVSRVAREKSLGVTGAPMSIRKDGVEDQVVCGVCDDRVRHRIVEDVWRWVELVNKGACLVNEREQPVQDIVHEFVVCDTALLKVVEQARGVGGSDVPSELRNLLVEFVSEQIAELLLMFDGGKRLHVAARWHDHTKVGTNGGEKVGSSRLLPRRHAHQKVRLDIEDDCHGISLPVAVSFRPPLC
jgi:hypothetical protein